MTVGYLIEGNLIQVEDLIRCRGRDDRKKKLAELSEAGYGAVVANDVISDKAFSWIRITSLPAKKEDHDG